MDLSGVSLIFGAITVLGITALFVLAMGYLFGLGFRKGRRR